MKPNTSRLAQTRAPSGVAFLTTRFSCMKVLPFARRYRLIIPCFPLPGNRETRFLPRGAAVSKNFQKYFCAHALKKEAGALLWQNGNEITFRETELAFLIRLFTGYLQLYPPHTHKLLLALQRLRDTRAGAFSFKRRVPFFNHNTAPGALFGSGHFRALPLCRTQTGHTTHTESAVFESLPLTGKAPSLQR